MNSPVARHIAVTAALWRLGENGVAYQYNLRTVRLSDGRLSHTGTALSERGTMLVPPLRESG